jgi:hypothetical protein
VTLEAMIATAADHTARAALGRHVLAIQDTTEINFSGHEGSKRGFGVVGNGKDIGFFLHPVLVTEAGSGPSDVGHCGGIVGLADAFVRTRAKAPPGGRKSREAQRKKGRPIDMRESGRWLDGLRAAERTLAGAAMVTVVADCESDIYDLFAAPRAGHVHLLVRAAHDRCLEGGTKLLAEMAASPPVAGWRITVPAKPGRAERSARVAASFKRIEIKRPHYGHNNKSRPETIALTAIRVAEVDAPEGAPPIAWVLLTTHAVANAQDVARIVGWYRARWTIEQVFRSIKTQGFDLERSQIETPQAMAKLAIGVLIAAVGTMQLVHARSGATGQKLTDALEQAAAPLVEALTRKLEGKTARLKNPHPPDTLARLAWVVGRLGGWDGYDGHGYKPAGPKTMAIGLEQFDAIRTGWEMQRDDPLAPADV